MIQVTNSLSRKKEPFQTLEPKKVRMYVCGPTVYNFIHIGNARPLVFFDVVRRYLTASGFDVTYVMNFTDVDDKIIDRAAEEKIPWTEVTNKYINEYRTDMKLLGTLEPTRMPKVSDHIAQIITMIEGLIKNGFAYVVEGEVFYSVRKFKDYGKLSGKNVDDLRAGARVEVDARKQDPLDFTLWKPRKTADEPAWESPWGLGRPGWHIECSAMATTYLGETFDLHGGGMDLIHPHHENEIAQSEGCSLKPFARYWLHNNMLNMNSEKMSKSLGNILLTREFIQKYSAEVLKYLLLSGHYRSVIDFSDKHIHDVQASLHRYYHAKKKAENIAQSSEKSGTPSEEETKASAFAGEFQAKWREAMDDDFNTAKVMGMVFEYVRAVNACFDKKGFQVTATSKKLATTFLSQFAELSQSLNVLGENTETFLEDLKSRVLLKRGMDRSTIDSEIEKRAQARKAKDFKTADDIRQRLLQQGVELRDSATGTDWDVTF